MYCLFQADKEETAAVAPPSEAQPMVTVDIEEDPIQDPDVQVPEVQIPGGDQVSGEAQTVVAQLTIAEYNAMKREEKSDFYRPAAARPMREAGGGVFVCSALEDPGEFYQDANKTLPILPAIIA